MQRYGAEVAGGAEALCRATARALAAGGDQVEVYTTTARDYLHWRPHYPAGQSDDDGVRVHRFDALPADPQRSSDLLRSLTLGDRPPHIERAWARAQGPLAPGLIAALATARARHEAVALWTYLYATTQMAMPLVADRSVLVPLAHDEPMFGFPLTRGLVRMAAGFAFLTPEERRLVDDLHGLGDRPQAIVGAGIDDPIAPDPAALRRAHPDLPERFALYIGRIDPAKGLHALIEAHAAYRRSGGRLGLVLAGRAAGEMALPEWVHTTGFVDDSIRSGLLDACEVVVLPSPHESLSLVALEAWRAARPTLANAASEVLAGQSARSGAGLLYHDAATYTRQLRRLDADPALRRALAASGSAWVADQTWPACARRWRGLLARVRRPLVPAPATTDPDTAAAHNRGR